VLSKIVSKVLVDEGILGRHGKKVFFLVFSVLRLVGGDVGEDVKADNWGGGDGGAGDNIIRTVGGVEREAFDVVKGGPGRSRRWRVLKLGGLRGDGLKDAGGDVKGTWVIPSVMRTLEDLVDGGSGVRNVLLIDVIKGGPRGSGDVREGGGGDDGGLRGSEGHLRQLAPL